jgi:formiminoglutamase
MRLQPYPRPADLPERPDDPRLGSVVEFRTGGLADIPAGRPVIVGFPQDEGVRRNGGRVGAALAPDEIRRWLYRLVPCNPDPETPADLAALGVIDLGNLEVTSDLEASQAALGGVVAELLLRGAIPIVLGGGHETAYGVYLGHLRAHRLAAILNLDAHLDVRPTLGGLGHSGSPFRQALEHPTQPLPGRWYSCQGVLPSSASRAHVEYVFGRRGTIRWNRSGQCAFALEFLDQEVHLSIDADVVRAADVPGVSAPNPTGVPGADVIRFAGESAANPRVSGVELVEINPRFDLDGRSARWGAQVAWNFLCGLARRPSEG